LSVEGTVTSGSDHGLVRVPADAEAPDFGLKLRAIRFSGHPGFPVVGGKAGFPNFPPDAGCVTRIPASCDCSCRPVDAEAIL
jgi:hypothetical protein